MNLTYSKRARQLVKQGRAAWVGDDSIRLLDQLGKDTIMETETTTLEESPGISTKQESENAVNVSASTQAQEEAMMELAKENIAVKKKLIRQGADLVLLAVFLFLLAVMPFEDERFVLAFVFGLFWLIRYIRRVIEHVRPTMKEGFSTYLRQRKESKVQAEYLRIKAACQGQQNQNG